jgi:hypothetical protein
MDKIVHEVLDGEKGNLHLLFWFLDVFSGMECGFKRRGDSTLSGLINSNVVTQGRPL